MVNKVIPFRRWGEECLFYFDKGKTKKSSKYESKNR